MECSSECESLRAAIGLERLKVRKLEQWKDTVEIAFTAGMLAMQHESLNGGRKLSAHEFVTSMQVAMRQAESEFMRL